MKPTLLRALLICVLLTVQLGTVVVVMLSMQRLTEEQFNTNAKGSLNQFADQVTDQTRRFLSPAETALQIARQMIAGGALDSTNDQRLEQFFAAQLGNTNWLKGLYLGRSDGSFTYVSRNDAGLLTKVISVRGNSRTIRLTQRDERLNQTQKWMDPLDSYDPRSRPWYQLARKTDSLVWTGAYSFFSSRLPGISAAVAVSANGEDAGVLGVDVDIQELSEFIAQVPNSLSGTAIIVDEEGYTVAYSDFRKVQTEIQNARMPSMNAVADIALKDLYKKTRTPSKSLTKPRGDILQQTINGEKHLSVARPFSISDGKVNWLLLAQSPMNEYSGGLAQLFVEKLWTLIAIIVLPSAIAIVAVFRLTRPIFQLHEDSTFDGLTNALTRKEFERRLASSLGLRRKRDPGSQLVIAALDLDGFKQVNDVHGHAAGDDVLIEVVKRLKNRLRKSDLLGRFGGDEFMLAMHIEAAADAHKTIDDVRANVVAETFSVNKQQHSIGITAGIAVRRADESTESLLARADQALISGKARQKNRSYMAPDSTGEKKVYPHIVA